MPVKGNGLKLSARQHQIVYFSIVAVLAAILVWLMFQFDPGKLGVGRYPAIHNWIARLFAGQYPYWPDNYPSGFPFLFIMAIPFYLIGDLGFLQIFSFVIFAIIVYYRHGEHHLEKLRIILLLMAAPAFLYEVAVHSELFSNMTAVLLYLTVFEMYCARAEKRLVYLISLGLVGGFLLSTRGIVLLIYIVFLGYLLVKYRCRYIIFGISMFIGFMLTLLPFMIWNWSYFVKHGPFTIQMWYIPAWFLALAIVCSAACILTVKSSTGAFYVISIILFGIVLYPFIMRISERGLTASVLENYFDISYFCFSLPFILLSFKREKNEIEKIV